MKPDDKSLSNNKINERASKCPTAKTSMQKDAERISQAAVSKKDGRDRSEDQRQTTRLSLH